MKPEYEFCYDLNEKTKASQIFLDQAERVLYSLNSAGFKIVDIKHYRDGVEVKPIPPEFDEDGSLIIRYDGDSFK